MIDKKANSSNIGVASIASPCSARKGKLPETALQARFLPRGTQKVVSETWVGRLTKVRCARLVLARDLYAGTAFRRARVAADAVGCSLFVISAGLGLVAGTTLVPAYDLTLSPSAASPLQARLTGEFAPPLWWAALQHGPFASPLADLGRRNGRILVALTQPYAALIGSALAALPVPIRGRLRLLGSGLIQHLPTALRGQAIQYDVRLNVLNPGMRMDAAARALAHFARLIASIPVGSVEDDQQAVESALANISRPVAEKRPRVSDETLSEHIVCLARRGLSATNALRYLRCEAHMACEERRFRRLYEEALA